MFRTHTCGELRMANVGQARQGRLNWTRRYDKLVEQKGVSGYC